MLESISVRDMFLLLRMTDNSPSLEEMLKIFALLSKEEINILQIYKNAPDAESGLYSSAT